MTWLSTIVCLIVSIVGSATPAMADSVTSIYRPIFPDAGRHSTSSIFDGENAYIFGGCCKLDVGRYTFVEWYPDIYRFNPPSNTLTKMNANLGEGLMYTSAVYDGRYAYIFGGASPYGVNTIRRYDIENDSVQIMNAHFPTATWGTSAVWDGSDALIFGGQTPSGNSSNIYRYSPATDTLTKMKASLSHGSSYTSAVWDGENAYIFGAGHRILSDELSCYVNCEVSSILACSSVYRYNPTTDELTQMDSCFPPMTYSWAFLHRLYGVSANFATAGTTYSSAIWNGTYAFIFNACCTAALGFDAGPSGSVSTPGPIYRFDPKADKLERMDASFPKNRSDASAIWDGKAAYVFGGRETDPYGQYHYYADIAKYDLSPSAPTRVVARPGPNLLSHITLSWEPTSPTSYGAPLLEYRIYRGGSPQYETYLTSVSPSTTSYLDPACFSTICSYYVTAKTVHGESPPSNRAVSAP